MITYTVQSSPIHQTEGKLTLEALREEGVVKLTPLDIFGFKFLLFDRWSKALVQPVLCSLIHLLTLIT